MSESSISGTRDDAKERIDIGIAFLVLFFMGGLGAYLMTSSDTDEIVSGLPDTGANYGASVVAPTSNAGSAVAGKIDPDELRELRELRAANSASSAVIAEPLPVLHDAEAPAELPAEALAVVEEKAEPLFQPTTVPEVIEPAAPEPEPEPEPQAVAEVEARAEVPADVSEAEVAVLRQATSNVSFVTGSAVLTEDSTKVLDEIVELLRSRPDTRLSVIGYTDSQGDPDENVALSFARAEACRDYLLERGATVGQVDSAGMGERNPIGDNSTPEGRRENRRVEFTLLRGRR